MIYQSSARYSLHSRLYALRVAIYHLLSKHYLLSITLYALCCTIYHLTNYSLLSKQYLQLPALYALHCTLYQQLSLIYALMICPLGSSACKVLVL